MKFLIYPNITSRDAMSFAEKISHLLAESGHQTVQYGVSGAADGADMVLAVGGDGTVLRAVHDLHETGMPVWAVNLGHLGYLTETDADGAETSIRKILSGEYWLQDRVMLSGRLTGRTDESGFCCLNEAAIHRSGYSRNLHMELSVSGTPTMTFSGDGILVSTPTGSTAYNLSAGGPILMPDSDQLVVTPICPHGMVCPPIVIPAGHVISIRVLYENGQDEDLLPRLTMDGMERQDLYSGDVVQCQVDAVHVPFVKTGNDSFYQRLQKRLAAR